MIDLTKITAEEANKIECALIQLEGEFKKMIDSWSKLSYDEAFSDKARKNFASNAMWWGEVYGLLFTEDK